MYRVLPFLLICTGIALAAPVESKAPSTEEIRKAIDDLGNKRFAVRDKAKKFLFDAGAPAEPYLEEAALNTDEEISNAAKAILERFHWGIYPDTPEPVRNLIDQFRAGTPEERQQALGALLRQPGLPLPTLRKLIAKEENPEIRNQMLARLHMQVREALPGILARGDIDGAENLLDMLLVGEARQIGEDYAVFMLQRGKLDGAIARFEKQRQIKGPEGKRAEELLVYLYRVKGDWPAALKAARAANNTEMIDRIHWRSFDWKALAEAGRPPEIGPFLPVGAAYDRLSGNKAGYEAKMAELKKGAQDEDEDFGKLRLDVNALLLNGRANDAIEILVDKKRHLAFTFDLLCSQMRHKEAFDLVNEARRKDTDTQERDEIEIRRARMLYLLGDKESATQLFDKLADKIRNAEQIGLASSLIKAEARAGLVDRAADHAAQTLDALGKIGQRGGYSTFLEPVFGDNKGVAATWWLLFREEKPNEEPAVAMKRVRDILKGKLDRKQTDEWLTLMEKRTAEREPDHGGEPRSHVGSHDRERAIATVYRTLGDEKKTIQYLVRAAEGTKAMDGFISLGDYLVEVKKYRDAAEAYGKAAKQGNATYVNIDIDDDFQRIMTASAALPMYLQARALLLAGDKAESKRLADVAHWIPLGNEMVRATLVENLAKRDWPGMARKEADFLLKTGWYSHYSYGNVLSYLARTAAKEKDYFTAADYYEKCLVGCLRTGASFIEPTAYLLVPESVRVYRARGLAAQGKIDEALKEANDNLAVMPGNVDLAIKLVPDLEKLGRKKEADEMYAKVRDAWEKLCKEHPTSAFGHNSAAWVMANCQRDLDAALAHSLKAVELEPKSAGYIDTLAEVYFRKGDRDKALKLMKECVELDPKHAYFHKQLTRFKDQPFTSPTPDENEDE